MPAVFISVHPFVIVIFPHFRFTKTKAKPRIHSSSPHTPVMPNRARNVATKAAPGLGEREMATYSPPAPTSSEAKKQR